MTKLVFNVFTHKLDYVGTSGGGGGSLNTLTGNTGGAVPPTAGNINVIGVGAISVQGVIGTSTLTITSGNPFFVWQVITSSQTAVTQNGYFTNGTGTIQLQLPSTSNVGDIFTVAAINSSLWQVTQANSQQILFGDRLTTAGSPGYIISADLGDTAEFVCYVGSKTNPGAEKWMIIDSIGSGITVM